MTQHDVPTDGDSKGSPGSGSQHELRSILEECYGAIEDGREPDLALLCSRAPHLRARVEGLLGLDSDIQGRLRGQSARTRLASERLGDFQLLERIGSGGMGEVWRAVQQPLGREVALKILSGRLTDSPAALRRFRREAEVTAALAHPNIVPVYAVGEGGGVAWIAMRLLSGPSLASLTAPMTPLATARVGAAVARALHAAHLEGVIHRDVKPANIVLDGDEPILVDFGLARSLEHIALTSVDAVPGTLPYIAPEQLGGSRAAEPRSDVYSLCAALFEVVAGRPPFVAASPEVMVREVLDDDPPPLGVSGARELETILRRGLEKEPSRRFPTAEALAQELERFAAGAPILSRRRGIAGRIVRAARRRPRTAAAIALLGAALVAAGVYQRVGAATREREDMGTLARAATAAAEGRLGSARLLIEDLLARAPYLDGLAAQNRQLRALEALEVLLDEIQSLPPDAEAPEVAQALSELDSSGADVRRPLSDLARAAAHLHLGEPAAARERLAVVRREYGESRALVAFEMISRGEALDASDELGERRALGESFGTRDDAVFCALALRLGGVSPARQERELEDCLGEGGARDDRMLYALAATYHDAGRFDAAHAAWLGLAHDGRYRPTVLCNLALAAMALGRLDLAEAYLDAVPRGRYELRVAKHRLELAARRGLDSYYLEALKTTAESWPGDGWIALRLGLAWLERDEVALAARSFARVEQADASRTEKHTARQGLLLVELRREELEAAAHVDLGPEEREIAEALRARAQQLVATAPSRHARSDSLLILSQLERVLGLASAAETLDLALAADSANPNAMGLFLARLANACVSAAAGAPVPASAEMARGRAMIDQILALRARGQRPASNTQVDAALEAGVLFALVDGGLEALNAAEQRICDLRGAPSPALRAKIARVRAHVEAAR
jgi:hypothetical protein